MSGWRKATASTFDGNCVGVATIPVVAVRDMKQDGTGPVLTFTAEQWEVFRGPGAGAEIARGSWRRGTWAGSTPAASA